MSRIFPIQPGLKLVPIYFSQTILYHKQPLVPFSITKVKGRLEVVLCPFQTPFHLYPLMFLSVLSLSNFSIYIKSLWVWILLIMSSTISWGNPFWGILMVLISLVLVIKGTNSASVEQIKQKERPLVPPDADMKVWKVEYQMKVSIVLHTHRTHIVSPCIILNRGGSFHLWSPLYI